MDHLGIVHGSFTWMASSGGILPRPVAPNPCLPCPGHEIRWAVGMLPKLSRAWQILDIYVYTYIYIYMYIYMNIYLPKS